MHRSVSILCCIALLTATGCGSLPGWMGGKKDHGPKLPGERIAVLSAQNTIVADNGLQSLPVTLPAAAANADWVQAGQNAGGHIDRVAFSGAFANAQKAPAGKSSDWDSTAIPAPVVADGKVFALDGRAYVSAHEAGNIAHVLWVSEATASPKENEVIGGGLACGDGTLYVASGNGKIAALDALTGKKRWTQSLAVALRSAPRLFEDKLFVTSLDNQLFALSTTDGRTLWTHHGISEAAGFLDIVTPAAENGIVVVAYSSGEIHGLRAGSGEEVWADSLALPQRTTATETLTGISGNPFIAGGIVYAAGNGGMMTAGNLENGRRIWEQEISAVRTPWVAGDFVFALTADRQLVVLRSSDGRVRWVQKLPAERGASAAQWSGPVLAGDALMLVGSEGKVMLFDPSTGNYLGERGIASHIYSSPVIAGGVFYAVSQDGTLYSYR